MSDEELNGESQAQYQAQVEAMVEQLHFMALPFADASFDAKNQLLPLAENMVKEQAGYMTTIIPAMMKPQEGFESEIEMYVWRFGTGPESKPKKTGLQIVQPNGELQPTAPTFPDLSDADPAILDCPKRLEGIEDPMQAMSHGCCHAFLLSPVARAVLRMNGWLYGFNQKKIGK